MQYKHLTQPIFIVMANYFHKVLTSFQGTLKELRYNVLERQRRHVSMCQVPLFWLVGKFPFLKILGRLTFQRLVLCL